MRAIARSAVLLCLAAGFACADAHDDVIGVVTDMAGALIEVNVPQFMTAFSKSLPEYDTLERNVRALVTNADVSSSVVPVTEDAKGDTYAIDLDWLLEVRSLEQDGPIVRRREVIHCQLRKEKKRWKIVALTPLDFFAPANPGR